MRAFLTGSHAYGEPHENSDVDLVVPCDAETARRVRDLLGASIPGLYGKIAPTADHYGAAHVQMTVGKLNLILVDSRDWRAWKRGTERLEEMAAQIGPVPRAVACKILAKERRPPWWRRVFRRGERS